MLTANQGHNSAGFKNNPYITASKIPSYAPRVMLAQGMALDAAGDLSGAKHSYSAAVVLFRRLGATEDTSPSYAAAVARLQKANSRLF
jgi:predicted RNA polymerase sigma factor